MRRPKQRESNGVPVGNEDEVPSSWGTNAGAPFRISLLGVPVVAQWVKNPANTQEDADPIPGLAQWIKGPALP